MKVDFKNIQSHTIPLEDFRLKWRFTEDKYDMLPDQHLSLLQPLDKTASRFLWNFIASINLHEQAPFAKGFFRKIDKARVLENNKKEVKKWLGERGLPFSKPVFLSWQPDDAMVVPWKILIKYFDSFYYGGSDDLTVIDQSLMWALLFHHEGEVYFGTNNDFKPSKNFEPIDFVW